jgi:hypothetical protein
MYAMHLMLTVTLDGYRPFARNLSVMRQGSFEPQETTLDVVASAYVSQRIQAWPEAGRTTECAPVPDSIDVNLCQNSRSRGNQNGSTGSSSVVYSYKM